MHPIPRLACASLLFGLALGDPAAAQPAAAAKATTPTLVINGPITRWDEGLPIGNGLIGALVWGEGRTIRISLDRADLWDTRLPEIFSSPDWTYANMVALKEARNHDRHRELFDVPYDTIAYPTKLPAGRVEITLPEDWEVSGFELEPGQDFASVETRGTHDGIARLVILTVAESEPSLLAVGLPPGFAFEVKWPTGLGKLGYPQPVRGEDGASRWFTQRTLEGVAYTVVATSAIPALADDAEVVSMLGIAVGASITEPESMRAARQAIDEASGGHLRSTLPRYQPSREAWFGVSRVRLPDPALQLHYDLCKHYSIAGSASDQPPMPLQGVWTADEGGLPPWKGDYHNDLNTQMTYLAYHAAGLVEQGMSWINFNWSLMAEYRAFASGFFGLPARDERYADARHEPALIPGVMTIDGKPMGGWGQYSLSPTHSAWIAQSFYLHWKCTDDDAFLRDRAYPFCAAIGNGLLGLMTKDEHGHLKLPLSSSPEIHDNSYAAWLVPNSNYDLSLMRWLFASLKEMSLELGDKETASRWADALGSMEPLHVDEKTGLMFDAREKYEQSHRHFSHAMAIHPLGTLTIEGSDADRAAINATLDQMNAMGTSWWCGYSFSWASCMFARAGRAEEALDYLIKYLSFTGPNGFHLNGDQTKSGLSNFTYRPFTLEGNFLAMQAIHEMMLQSWGEVGTPDSETLRIFPAVSARWADVSFDGLRAEGGWSVSARRQSGRTTRVEIVRPAGSRDRVTSAAEMKPNAPTRTLRLRDPFPGREAHWSRPVTRDGADILADFKPGELLVGEAR